LEDIMSEKIIPTGDNVVVQLVERQKTKGGIIIPDKARTNQRDAIIGKVLAIGPGRVTEYGVKVDAGVNVGDYVLIARGAGVEIELAAEARDSERKIRILRGVEILGTVEESRIIQLGLVT
jgi:chaperonin GroES